MIKKILGSLLNRNKANNDTESIAKHENNSFDFPNGKFIFLDVETANSKNDTICSIGLIIIDEGNEIINRDFLINPLSEFSQFNINIHKITPDLVRGCMTFKEFWGDFGTYFDGQAIIVAHNAKFDIAVIKKDLSRFDIELTTSNYIDTMDLFKKYYYKGVVKKGDLKLNNISKLLGISLDHHHAHSDTKACFEIFKYVIEKYDVILDYDVKSLSEHYKTSIEIATNVKMVTLDKYWKDIKSRDFEPYFANFGKTKITVTPAYDEILIEDLLFCYVKEGQKKTVAEEYNIIESYIVKNGGRIYSGYGNRVKCVIDFYIPTVDSYMDCKERGLKLFHSLDVIKFIENNPSPNISRIAFPNKKVERKRVEINLSAETLDYDLSKIYVEETVNISMGKAIDSLSYEQLTLFKEIKGNDPYLSDSKCLCKVVDFYIFRYGDFTLLDGIKSALNPIDLHFTLIHLSDCIYKKRNEDSKFIEITKRVCQKDLLICDNNLSKLSGCILPTLPRLINIYINQEEYLQALEICKFAIKNNIRDVKEDGYQKRYQRIQNKMNKNKD